jgi:hypothetical protein
MILSVVVGIYVLFVEILLRGRRVVGNVLNNIIQKYEKENLQAQCQKKLNKNYLRIGNKNI